MSGTMGDIMHTIEMFYHISHARIRFQIFSKGCRVCEKDFSCTCHIVAQYHQYILHLGVMLTRRGTVCRAVQNRLERQLLLLQQ